MYLRKKYHTVKEDKNMFDIMPFRRRGNYVSEYSPFRDMEEFEKRFFSSSALESFRTDIKDNGREYVLEMDMPGFKKEDINVDIEGGVLTVSAERHSDYEDEDKKKNYIRKERSYGMYKRSFDISEIDESAIVASYDNGMLKLVMPKREAQVPESRRLEIQ